MSHLLLLADVRPTDVWDSGNVIGLIGLGVIVAATLLLIRVTKRR